jgi:hypothetical protein
VFAGIIVSFVPILWFTGIRKRRKGQTEMVLIGAAAGELEVQTWAAALEDGRDPPARRQRR